MIRTTPYGGVIDDRIRSGAIIGTLVLLAAAEGTLMARSGGSTRLLILLLNGMLIVTPFAIRRIASLLEIFVLLSPIGVFGYISEGASTTILPLVGLAIAGLWTAGALLGYEQVRPVPGSRLLLALGAVAIMSAASNWQELREVIPTLTHLQLVILMYLVVQIVRSPRDVSRIAWLITLSQACVGLLAILAVGGVISIPGQEIDVETVLGYELVRVGGVSGGVNWVSAELLVGIVMAFNLLVAERRAARRAALLMCLAPMVIANVLTYSLGGWAALAVALGISIQGGRRLRLISVAKALAVASLLAFAVVSLVPGFRVRVDTRAQQIASQPAGHWFSSRVGTIQAGWTLMLREPVLGVGAGNSKYRLPEYLPFTFNNEYGAHNTYIEIGDEFGITGFVLFLGLLGVAGGGLGRALARRDPSSDSRRFATMIFAALVGLSVLGIVEGLERMKYLWILMGLALTCRAFLAGSEQVDPR